MLDVTTSLTMKATPEAIWHVLTDLPGHDAWDPLMRGFRGRLDVGETVRFSIGLGPARLPVSARVMQVDVQRELRWAGPSSTGFHSVVRGEHWFRLTELADGETRFDHGEHWSGVVPRALWRVIGPRLHADYDAMNRALAKRVASR
ncbi:MAG: SRPBCC domain-containing protein [Myxococcota bacterium]